MRTMTLLLFSVLLSCESRSSITWNPAGSDTTLSARLAALRGLDPEAQAQAAILRHDYSLLGVQGLGLSVPGFYGDHARYAGGVRVIDGTSDVTFGDLDQQYQREAAAYAERYNITIVTNRRP